MRVRSKRVLSAIICVSILLCCAAPSFAAVVDSSNVVSFFEDMFNDNESDQDPEVLGVNELISEIGKAEYTDDHLSKIRAAESAYYALSSTQKEKVSDYASLKAARYAYNALAADSIDTGSLTVTDGGQIGDLKWSVYSNGLLEISGSGAVPSYSTGSAPWYSYASSITSIIVRSSVSEIGSKAFYGCNYIEEITLPFIGESRDAVGYRSHLGYIFDYSSSDLYSYYYSGEAGDVYQVDSGKVYYIVSSSQYRYYTFSIPSRLKTVTVTDATKIHDGAFATCSNITTVVLNEEIASVGDLAFYKTKWFDGLEDEFVIVGDGVLIKYNGKLSGITLPENVKYIAGSVFRDNTKISAVELPDGLRGIDKNAFYGCSNLTSVTIPRSVISIGVNAFPNECTTKVYRSSAGYDYRASNRVVLNGSFTNGNDTYYYIINDDGCAEIIGCTTTSTEITVPLEIEGAVVNKIGDRGFAGCTTVNSITIPSNIKSIGDHAFEGCTGLINATIPTTVSTVGDRAFTDCTGLKNVTISEGVKAIGEGAFFNCISLEEVVIPDTAEYVGSYAFYNCTSLTTATVGTKAVSIGDYTFYNCLNLENVVIGYSVESIGDYAFYNCYLGRVSIPLATVSIGNYAFAENRVLKRAILRKGLLTVGDGAFRNCVELSEISVPSTVTSIGARGFENCGKISAITLPTGITEVNNRVFANCVSLSDVTFEGNVTKIGESAFCENAFASIVLPGSLEVIGQGAFRACKYLESITLPNAVTSVGGSAFNDCEALSRVSLPDSVGTVGDNVFHNNDDITVEIRNVSGAVASGLMEAQEICHVILDENISAIGNNTFNSCHKLRTVTYGDEEASDGEYKLSPAVRTVGMQAFKDNNLLCKIFVPDSLRSVGSNAFYRSVSTLYEYNEIMLVFYYVTGSISPNVLSGQHTDHITVNDGIHTLGAGAFSQLPHLNTISLPDTLSTVGTDVFKCTSNDVTVIIRGVDGTVDDSVFDGKTSGIRYIYIGDGVDTVGSYAFANSDTLKGVILEAATTVESYAFANCPRLLRVAMPKAETIGDYAFYNDIAVDRIDLGTQLCHIGDHAFDSCKSLLSIALPNTVCEIGSYAFYDCNNMVAANIPTGVAAIKEYTFFGCASLLEISLPDTVLSVGDYAYYGCVLVADLHLGSSLESIGAYAFYNCNKVKEIMLPNTLTHIGDYAFRSCSSITEISVPDSVTELGDCVFYACTGLVKGEFGYGITSIGNSEFYGCVSFKKLLLLGRVDHIHELAFYGAEDTAIYTFKNLYVKDYCDENYLEYHELGGDCTAIITPPAKTNYYEFEELDLTGLTLAVTYSDGTERIVTFGYTVSGYDPSVIGKQTVVVDYHGISQNFDVTVAEKEILSVSVKSLSPLKVIKGEDIDMSTAVITVNYSDGTSRVIDSGYQLNGFNKNSIGKQTVSLIYRNAQCDVEVTVVSNVSGDVNNDGKLTSRDILILRMAVSGAASDESLYSTEKADIDGDGKLTGRDVLMIRMIISGKR